MLDEMELNEGQREAIAKLQAEVDEQLASILTPEQLQQMKVGPRGRRGAPRGDRPEER